MIYLLDPEAFTILDSMVVPAPLAHLAVTGLYDVDYRIVVACRNGTICTLKRGWTEAKVLTMLETQAVGLIRREKFILVSTMDDCLQCFSSKGKRIWSQKLPASVKCLEPVQWTFHLEVSSLQPWHLKIDKSLSSMTNMLWTVSGITIFLIKDTKV